MTPPDPALADSFANWVAFVAVFVVGLWRRRKQNEVFAKDVGVEVEAATKAEVEEIKKAVAALQSAKEADATRSAILGEKINHLDGTLVAMNRRLDSFEEALPRATDVLEKVLNVLERLKAGTLVEKPIAGSGGLVALKPKEEKE